MQESSGIRVNHLLGIACLASATLIIQILLTRLFSSTLYYHYAFAVISLAMLGLTAGGIAVYTWGSRFPRQTTEENLAFFSGLGGIAIVVAMIVQLSFRFFSYITPLSIFGNFVLFLPGLVCSGVVIALLFVRYNHQISRLYMWDLCGAGLACIAAIFLLDWLGPVNGIFFAAALMGIGGLLFLYHHTSTRFFWVMQQLAVILIGIFIINSTFTLLAWPHLTVKYIKGRGVPDIEYRAWNSYSHVQVTRSFPPGWRRISIDNNATTTMVKFDPKRPIRFRHDIRDFAYDARPISSVAVIGVGGGHDILAAIEHKAADILGIEINRDILYLLTNRYAKFSGFLGKRDDVRLVNAEARSYLASHPDKHDLIQISMIDTWAATAAGAFSLSENVLYTREGWDTFFNALNDNGILSITRWYVPGKLESEAWRTVAMAHAVLTKRGVTNPRQHMVMVHSKSYATLLLGKSPFTDQELGQIFVQARKHNYKIILSPSENTPVLGEIAMNGGFARATKTNKLLDISPSTDDRPFFFQTLTFSGALKVIGEMLMGTATDKTASDDIYGFNAKAIVTLVSVMIAVILLALGLLAIPLRIMGAQALRDNRRETFYFLGIGCGFMFIEIAQMQRLMIFLGHPTYALAVVLCTLLIASGIGSLFTQAMFLEQVKKRLLLLVGTLAIIGLMTNSLLYYCRGFDDWARILVAILLLLPLGFCMGMAFPIGVKLLSHTGKEQLIPWLWSINGAASVVASVLAVLVSIFAGITASYTIGVLFYALATGLTITRKLV